ncbi:hypothetical protein [Glycomyces buryatensis]|uniref:Uncharacterized protein n=1 Tax=Glycomyces buryatensis TaxID=2570927 RepID=A0A4S8QBH3_9ACTN|nr:hypothetical protein [Glycomyces buryatensis]THV40881.1 hypothetical protein FAB82_13585 [Glycomyces buryatensis]
MTDMRRKRRWIRASDGWIEFFLVPFALATVLGALWASAIAGDSDDEYGIPAIVLGVLWGFLFIIIDLSRYRHRAAWLLVLPMAGAVWAAWFAVYDYTMDERGIVEECPIVGTYDEEKETRGGGTYWVRTYTLECEHDTVTVDERIDSKPADDPYDSIEGGIDRDGTDPFDGDPFEPESIEVEYDPRGLLEARRTGDPGPDTREMQGLVVLLLVISLCVRLVAANARSHRDEPSSAPGTSGGQH